MTRQEMVISPRPPATEELVQQLVAEGLDIPQALIGQILARGDSAVAPLGLAGLRDPEAMEDLRKAEEKGLFAESLFNWESMEETYASEEVPPTISHDDIDPMDYFSAGALEYLKAMEPGNSPASRASVSARTAFSHDPAPRSATKPGRNQPCPCGSKRKFKKCCGSR